MNLNLRYIIFSLIVVLYGSNSLHSAAAELSKEDLIHNAQIYIYMKADAIKKLTAAIGDPSTDEQVLKNLIKALGTNGQRKLKNLPEKTVAEAKSYLGL